MCSIVGGTVSAGCTGYIQPIFDASVERGRDGWGFELVYPHGGRERSVELPGSLPFGVLDLPDFSAFAFLGCRRGEPAWEHIHVKQDHDMQPYTSGDWIVVHNGTIANDEELWASLGVEPEVRPTAIDSAVIPAVFNHWGFEEGLKRLKGSFAILAINQREPDTIYWACNYKPLWVRGSTTQSSYIFASQREYFRSTQQNELWHPAPVQLGPYAWGKLTSGGTLTHHSLLPRKTERQKVLVVCSGGLDSSVVAWAHHKRGDEVHLLHLCYSCRAELQEINAVARLADVIGCQYTILETDFFKRFADSPLTNDDATISDGRTGSEFAVEWVPARNTVMLALALAYAEAHGYDVIALGSNQEESGAYPDNEQEYVNRWRDLAPYAVAAYQHVEFSDPLAGFMKQDIIQLGHSMQMPFEVTWSCYKGGEFHCGQCGPCSMRRMAFQMAGVADPTKYET